MNDCCNQDVTPGSSEIPVWLGKMGQARPFSIPGASPRLRACPFSIPGASPRLSACPFSIPGASPGQFEQEIKSQSPSPTYDREGFPVEPEKMSNREGKYQILSDPRPFNTSASYILIVFL